MSTNDTEAHPEAVYEVHPLTRATGRRRYARLGAHPSMREALAATLGRLEAAESVAASVGDHVAAAAERVFAAGGGVCHLRVTCKHRLLTIVVSSTDTEVLKTRRTLG